MTLRSANRQLARTEIAGYLAKCLRLALRDRMVVGNWVPTTVGSKNRTTIDAHLATCSVVGFCTTRVGPGSCFWLNVLVRIDDDKEARPVAIEISESEVVHEDRLYGAAVHIAGAWVAKRAERDA